MLSDRTAIEKCINQCLQGGYLCVSEAEEEEGAIVMPAVF